ncbi:Protein timeless [Phytophthora citrophthora]|uniref:Protein timeless n=1 Tax=Phytophthora citrophthora TaxID=4793 RepID=A0AAD9LS49_9STRA|nr:Protein timeless [Phytophthora citrophthora]
MASPAAASAPAGRDAEPAASSAQHDEEELEDFAVSSSDEENDANEPQLDQDMMNELLLVCSNLGMLRVQVEGEAPVLMRGENCVEWIHDLQRAIRRDHAKHKLVAKQLGKWKILQKKLLPLLVNHQHDWKLVFSILKVLVMLTMKPPRDSTNIAQQLKYLRQYKHEFLRCGVIPIMMTILVDPLSRKSSARTFQDFLNMEIVLTLIRNLLAIPNEDPRFVTSTTSYFSHLQEDLICTLHEENVYEMILLFAQDIDSPENREWNLLIMEMIELTLDCSQPKSVVAFAKKQWAGETGKNSSSNGQTAPSRGSTVLNLGRNAAQAGGSLLEKLSSEKKASALHQSGSRRHSNFGGIMTMVGPTGRTTVLSDFSKTVYDQVPQAAKKPTSRRRGKKSAAPVTDIHEIFGGKGRVTESDEYVLAVRCVLCGLISLILCCFYP